MTRFSSRSHKASQKRLLNTLFSELSKQPKLLQLSFFWIPTLFGLLLLIGGLKYVYEVEVARPNMAYMGVPKTQNDLQTLTHVLRNDGFMLAYSEALANPVWVTYKVTPTPCLTANGHALKPIGARWRTSVTPTTPAAVTTAATWPRITSSPAVTVSPRKKKPF